MMNWNTLAVIVLAIGILSAALVKSTGAAERSKQNKIRQIKERKGR